MNPKSATDADDQVYEVGTKMVFRSRNGHPRDGQRIEVIGHAHEVDDWIPHVLRFEDGEEMQAHPNELVGT